jgi:hypothetical protein
MVQLTALSSHLWRSVETVVRSFMCNLERRGGGGHRPCQYGKLVCIVKVTQTLLQFTSNVLR